MILTLTLIGFRYDKFCYDNLGPETDKCNIPSTTILLPWVDLFLTWPSCQRRGPCGVPSGRWRTCGAGRNAWTAAASPGNSVPRTMTSPAGSSRAHTPTVRTPRTAHSLRTVRSLRTVHSVIVRTLTTAHNLRTVRSLMTDRSLMTVRSLRSDRDHALTVRSPRNVRSWRCSPSL